MSNDPAKLWARDRGNTPIGRDYFAGLGILVVGDDPLFRWAVKEVLTLAGHTVSSTTADLHPIRAAVDSCIPDVIVVMQCALPERQGTVIRFLRAAAPMSAIVVVLPDNLRETRFGAMRAGATRLLTDPVDMRALPAAVLGAQRCRPI
ncbi:MAG TPA: response regulator [Gemmatimonadaceae bacterium]|nr:response regulator [Gemmatimonadaceae bacterium]